jgi:hypothetical protein
MSGVYIVDINHASVWKAIEEYEIEEKIECFEKVIAVFSEIKAKYNQRSLDA